MTATQKFNQQDIDSAIAKLNMPLQRSTQITSRNAIIFKCEDLLAGGESCMQAAKSWIEAGESLANSFPYESRVLLREKALLYYGVAASHFYMEIANRDGLEQTFQLDTCHKYLDMLAHTYSISRRVGLDYLLEEKIREIKSTISKARKIYSEYNVAMMLINAAKELANLPKVELLIVQLYCLAAQSLRMAFDSIYRPPTEDLRSYHEAVEHGWAILVQLKDQQCGDEKDKAFISRLEIEFGNEIEAMNARWANLPRHQYSFFGIEFIPGKEKSEGHPTLRRRIIVDRAETTIKNEEKPKLTYPRSKLKYL